MRTKASYAVSLAFVGSAALAGAPDKIQFPQDYAKGMRYATVDRPDIKQHRELYTQPEVVEAVRKGRPIPSGAVITMVQWSVQLDEKGSPLKDADGRFAKKDIVGITVMEKRTGWGAEYPADYRNGEWEYAAFTPKGEPNPKANANVRNCFMCHLPHARQDYVISLAKLANTFPGQEALAKAEASDVRIAAFAFLPAKIQALAGKALTFVNGDDSPHQVSVVNGPKSAVFLRGEKVSLTLDKPGEYAYICGLHPTMKGVIEVK